MITYSLDGLRALAVMHIVVGHFSWYTNWTGVAKDGFSDGLDLMGGVSIGLFFLISGFVLMLGYGGADVAPAPRSAWRACRVCRCSCFFATAEEEPQPTPSGSSKAFDTRAFYWKRFARLMPLWYFGNVLSVPLYFGGYSPVDSTDQWWIGFALMLPPLGLNSWFQHLPPALHLWTISTMITFYLLFPVLYPRIRRIRPDSLWSFAMVLYCIQVLLFLLGFLGFSLLWSVDWKVGALRPVDSAALVAGYWFARSWPLNRLPLFVMGLCAARQCELEELQPSLSQTCCGRACCSRGIHRGLKAWLMTALVLLVVGLGIVEQVVIGTTAHEMQQGVIVRFFGEMLLPAVFYELLVAVAYPASAPGPPSRLHAFLGSRPMRFLADISLGVYVVHGLLVRSLVIILGGSELSPDGYVPPDWLMPSWGPLAMLPLSVVVGWAVTRLFETPVQKLILRLALGKG